MKATFRTVVLLRSDQTDGVISVIENSVPAGWHGPPLHHHEFDEAFYVLDGELTFQLGDGLATAGPNTLVFAPGNTPHTLANRGEDEARYLLVCTPAGFERYFDRLAADAAGVEPPAEARGPIPETTIDGPRIGEREDAPRPARLPPSRGRINVLVRSEQSAGRVAIMDNVVGAGWPGPRLHHHGFDELFHVLGGELTFQLGDQLVTRRSGELAFAPRGAHHTFANLGSADARTLIICTPAGFERYFARTAAEQEGVDPPDWAQQPTPAVTTVGTQITPGPARPTGQSPRS
jgi:mannose-6-phosphate isomerase-like protein (cupin superfamily)